MAIPVKIISLRITIQIFNKGKKCYPNYYKEEAVDQFSGIASVYYGTS